jgi:hypothetical protein
MKGFIRSTTAAVLGGAMLASTAMAAPPIEERVRALEKEISALHKELDARKEEDARRQAEALKAAAAPAPPPSEADRTMHAVAEKLSHFTPFGDVRLRYEGFYNRSATRGSTILDRDRARLRARIGFTYKHDDELSATLRIASGNPNDPISTNSTLDKLFTRDTVGLDWAFLTFTPGERFHVRPGLLALTGGKFPNPMFRTGEILFDDDLAFEGFAETVALLAAPHGPLERLDFHAIQASFAEVGNGADGWMIGGQIHPRATFGDVVVEGGLSHYWWHKPDLIAQALNTNSALFNSNLLTTKTTPTGTTITGYQSGFSHTDLALAVTVPDTLFHMPLTTFGDVLYNWEAKNDHNQLGLRGGASLGKTKARGDWKIGAYYERIEREAAISAFTFSDFGPGGTNQEGPVLQIAYQLADPLTIQATTFFTNYIDRPAGTTNPTQVRLQVDAQLKF